MATLRAATAAASLTDEAHPDHPPLFTRTLEGQFRATALVLEADTRLCFVSVDCLGVTADMAQRAISRIAAAGYLSPDHILICPTHTHHAFSTMDVLGLVSNREFVGRIEDGIVQAVQAAAAKLQDPATKPNDVEAELLFGMTQESTVGRNSRVLLKDGSIGWYGYQREDVVRPTGPFDPDIPIIALRRFDGAYAAVMYNRAVHNIGSLGEHAEVYSVGTYGLVAQEFERRHGGTTLYFPGAIGSSHNVTYEGSGVPTDEAIVRLVDALERGLQEARPALFGPLSVLRRPLTYPVREFDEAEEDAKVAQYSRRYLGAGAEGWIEVMRQQRALVAPHQGQERQMSLYAVRLGEMAIVGVPCEFFTRLGLHIRWRSPFKHTFVFGLMNDDCSYVGDREGYELGGYQMWVSPHCHPAPGTGEAIVEQALEMLEELRVGPDAPDGPRRHVPATRELRAEEGLALQRFFNTLGTDARRVFRPAGWSMSLEQCNTICRQSASGERYDLVLDDGREIVGWAFLQTLERAAPSLGIGLAEAYCGQGHGRALMDRLIEKARQLGKQEIELTVVQTNERARRLYESCGFVRTGMWPGSDGQDYFEMRLRL